MKRKRNPLLEKKIGSQKTINGQENNGGFSCLPTEVFCAILQMVSTSQPLMRLRIVSKEFNNVIRDMFQPQKRWVLHPKNFYWMEAPYWERTGYFHHNMRESNNVNGLPSSLVLEGGRAIHFSRDNLLHVFSIRTTFGQEKAVDNAVRKIELEGCQNVSNPSFQRYAHVTVFMMGGKAFSVDTKGSCKRVNDFHIGAFVYKIDQRSMFLGNQLLFTRALDEFRVGIRIFAQKDRPRIIHSALVANGRIYSAISEEGKSTATCWRAEYTDSVRSIQPVTPKMMLIEKRGGLYLFRWVAGTNPENGEPALTSRETPLFLQPCTFYRFNGIFYNAHDRTIRSFLVRVRNDDAEIVHGKVLFQFRASAAPAERPYMTLSNDGFTFDMSNKRYFFYFTRPLYPRDH